ncbi:hypothetical protein RHSIM_Rhsim02G0085000 [Rhododendron simsii]|uniref:RING-type E3 ubiquitin transferase n=1 Tax=Rhododendron simsii TaxID=118357 RepID=A0A834HGL9_RHOSS|nr:hypothetical protein RHSIM_Rhsim02G0085000 [Rhododendron simsii]
MANPEDTGPNSRNAKKPTPTELTKELEKLLMLILNEDDYAVQQLNKAICILSSLKENNARGNETTEEATRVISSLRELKIKESVPKEFKRPMSREITGDPVVVASGQTYDRPSIAEWFRQCHKTCPNTKQDRDPVVVASGQTYNCPSIEECFRQGLKARPKTKQELTNSLLTRNNLLKNIIDSLLDKMMSSSLSDQKSSAKTLRQLTKQYPPFRDLFGNEAVSKLHKPLDVPGNACLDLDLQLDIITTVFNISLPQWNKKVVAENLRVIPLLINALRTCTSKTKSNAAAALFKLSELDSNRTLIHESGALGPLIRLVGEGNSETMTDVCAATYMLCWDGANTDAHREKAVSDGAMRVISRKVKDGDFLDLLLPVLTTLSSLPSAAEEMGKMGVVACLLKIMMESGDKDSNAVKSCAAILFDIYSFYKQEEAANGTISSVALRPEGDSKGPEERPLGKALAAHTAFQRLFYFGNGMSHNSVQVFTVEGFGSVVDYLDGVLVFGCSEVLGSPGSDGAFRVLPREWKGWMHVMACLLKITRDSGNKDSNAVESCAAILFDICSYDKDEVKEVKQEEAANGHALMANPEDSNPGSRNAETPAELKKEREIETTDEAIRIVSSPRELKIKESAPKEFKCPMSAEIMGDPVVVASGQGIVRSPTTSKVSSMPQRFASPNGGYLDSLLNDMMSSSLSDQKSSAKTLRWLTDEYPRIGDIIATVLNISLPEGNKKVVAENPRVIALLIDALRTGTTMTKRNAAAALSKLSELDSNRTHVVESAMYMLCSGPITDTYGEKAVSDGAVRVVLRKVMDGAFLDLLLPVLETLSRLPSAAKEMGRMGAVACCSRSCGRGVELKEVKQEEAAKGTISRVAPRGTQRARRKATGILEMGNNAG